MRGFVDETLIEVASGSGGSGAVSFRREKYIPRGGPDGGDGGDGGRIVFRVRENLKTLSHLRGRRNHQAENGGGGSGKHRHGRNGQDAIISVPPGTLVKRSGDGSILVDLCEPGQEWVCLEGGRGGRGNSHYKSSRRQAPRYAQPGKDGQRARLLLELKIIADAGFVGLPNAGKSTLLSVLTNARPKVASYPFTTLVPNLGVMVHRHSELILGDIPGIIEGAAEGAGLGLEFLRHISRSAILVFVIDVSEDSPEQSLRLLVGELQAYGDELLSKKRVIVGTKTDLPSAVDGLHRLEAWNDEARVADAVHGVSSVTGAGIGQLKDLLIAATTTGSEE